ncbi:hypothetical protein BGX30_012638 [Mortierella sp. GBA39]|nr:hypothetical protein BGX30_012638 [Mortierella sp. GBA39]
MTAGLMLLLLGLALWIPKTTRSDTPDAYYIVWYCLKLLLPTAGLLLMVIGSFVYSVYKDLYREIRELKDHVRSLEKKISVFLLSGCSEVKKETAGGYEDWQQSPSFAISKSGPDGNPVPYGLKGSRDRFAIVDGLVQANSSNKQLLHFWGDTPEETGRLLDKEVKVIGTSRETGEQVTAFEGKTQIQNDDPVKEPREYVESVGYLNLPAKGLWKLDAYIDGKASGSIVIEVRKDWFRWCESVPEEELLRTRTGGVGGIMHTLFHIVDVEWSWVRCLQGKPDFQESFDGYRSLDKVLKLQESFKPEVEEFVYSWNDDWEYNVFRDVHPDGHPVEDKWGEVVRHMIAHEIHHVGQLSVWSRELGIKPVSANLIGRGLMSRQA